MAFYENISALRVSVENGVADVVLRYQGTDLATRDRQHAELTQIWRLLERDDQVKAVFLTGVGDEEFYLSGRPSRAYPASLDEMRAFARLMETEVTELVHEMARFEKPVVAAVNGAAAGAGLAVVMLADIAVMAEDAWLFDPHIMLGISAGDGPGAIWPLFTGIAKAKLYLLTSDGLTGRQADEIGLIARAVPRGELMSVARDYVERLAAAPPIALRYTKRGLNQPLRVALLQAQDYAAALEALSGFSGERTGDPLTPFPPRIVP
jgi:enoyl-CoA hydratase